MNPDWAHPMIGKGVYTLAEASRLTGYHHSTVRSWFRPTATMRSAPLFHGDFRDTEMPKLISFLDLVDISVAGMLRHQAIPMPTVRKVYNKLKTALDTEHPFCLDSFLLYLEGKRVYVDFEPDSDESSLVDMLTDQHFIATVMMPHLQRFEYEGAPKQAARWNIYQDVVLDPELRFGEPVVKGTRISTIVLARAFVAEDEDADFVGELYGVSPAQVLSAVAFERQLSERKRAA